MNGPIPFVAAGAAASPAANPILSFFPLLIIFAIFYLLILRPQQKRTKEHKKILDALKRGDRVLTQGGLYGMVINLRGSIVELKIAEQVKVEVAKSAVTEVWPDGAIPAHTVPTATAS